jgi:hypothetical protein
MVLIPPWTQTPFQLGLVSSIFFLSSPEQLTRVTFTVSAYPIGLPESCPNSLPELHPRALPDRIKSLPGLIRSYPAELPYSILLPIRLQLTRPYTVLPGRIILPDLFPVGIMPTRSYLATLPDFLTQPGNTSLHLTTYPTLPNHHTRPGTLQLDSPETSSSASHLDFGLFWPIMHQDSSGNPKPTQVTLKQSG